MARIILASSSPYRKELLKRLIPRFDSAAPGIDESPKPNENPQELVKRLAIEKTDRVAKKLLNVIIIGSDQVAVCDQKMLGKPGSIEKAKNQLQFVSGKTVTFFTGLCVMNTENQKLMSDVIQFDVEFRKLQDQQIESYLEKEPALNCVGSFKSEGLGIALTNRMTGDDPTALIGLPLIRLSQMLEALDAPVI